jgi:hypothetical protein
MTGGWRKLHNEELHSLYSSTDTIRVIITRGMNWAGHAARIGEKCLQNFDAKPDWNRLFMRSTLE